MKMIVLVSILILLTGCAVRDCQVNPQLTIENKQNKTQSESDSESKDKNPKSLIKDIQDKAQPGGQLNCKF